MHGAALNRMSSLVHRVAILTTAENASSGYKSDAVTVVEFGDLDSSIN